MKSSLLSLLEVGQGQYEAPHGARRQVDIEFGLSPEQVQEVTNTVLSNFDRAASKQGAKYDREEVLSLIKPLLSERPITINMWPKHKEAMLIYRHSHSGNDKPAVISQFVWRALSAKIVEDLKDFGLVGALAKTQRERFKAQKDQLFVKDEESQSEDEIKSVEDIAPGTDETKKDFYIYGKNYETGNIKLTFVEDIEARDLKDFLALSKGYNVKGVEENDDLNDNIMHNKPLIKEGFLDHFELSLHNALQIIGSQRSNIDYDDVRLEDNNLVITVNPEGTSAENNGELIRNDLSLALIRLRQDKEKILFTFDTYQEPKYHAITDSQGYHWDEYTFKISRLNEQVNQDKNWFSRWLRSLSEIDSLRNYYYKKGEAAVAQYLKNKYEQTLSPFPVKSIAAMLDNAFSSESNSFGIREQVEPSNESPIFKTKKAVVAKRVSELIKSLDELEDLITKEPETELSDLVTIFSDLVNKLEDVGLLGKSE